MSRNGPTEFPPLMREELVVEKRAAEVLAQRR